MTTTSFNKKQILVLGTGITGASITRYLKIKGASVSVFDDFVDSQSADLFSEKYPDVNFVHKKDLNQSVSLYDFLAISPGIPKNHPIVQKFNNSNIPVVGDVEIFFWGRSIFKDSKVIGITGSNGKTTVTEMVGNICRAAGKDYILAGNIGFPVLNILIDFEEKQILPPEIIVLELSSFQLDSMYSHTLDIGVLLNITEDHLDRYPNFKDYVNSKFNIFSDTKIKIINTKELFSHNVKFPETFTSFGTNTGFDSTNWSIGNSNNKQFIFYEKKAFIATQELKVLGMHNVQNAMASAAVCVSLGIKHEWILSGLVSFTGLPHRVTLIRELNNIKFIDDSKGTNVGAVMAALNNYSGNAIAILGGESKGQNFSTLTDSVNKGCRGVVLIGIDRGIIANSLRGVRVPVTEASDMDEAVKIAYLMGENGDSVVLSPGCASFDMFENYKDRAHKFKKSIDGLVDSI